MLLDSIDSIVKHQQFPHVLLLFGKEHFLRDEALQRIISVAVPDTASEFDLEVVEADSTTQEQVSAMASAFPFISERRVVVVKNIERYASGKGKKQEKNSAFLRYLQQPSDTTLLILTADSSELEGITSLANNPKSKDKYEKKIAALRQPFHYLIHHCACIEFPALYDREIPTWIAKRIKSEGRDMSSEAIELLHTHIGSSMRDLHNEIQKLLLYSPQKKKFSVEDVHAVVGNSRSFNIFELQKAIGKRDVDAALNIVFHLTAFERYEILIVTMLTKYFTALWKLSEASQNTSNSFELGKTAEVNHFFVPEYIAALRLYTSENIERAFFALRDADSTLKFTSQPPQIVMQSLILSIMSK